MKKLLLSLVVFYIALIVLMPKINLYYTLEDFLKPQLVEISQKSLHDNLFALEAKDAEIFYDKAKVAEAKTIKISPFLFYNKVLISDITLANAVKNIFNQKTEQVELSYSLFNFSNVKIKANGEFGEIDGEFSLSTKKLTLRLSPTKDFEKSKTIKKFFKKDKDGYIHESNIR